MPTTLFSDIEYLKGVGKALMDAALELLRDYKQVAVWVLKGQAFTHIPVQCGSSDGKRTLITNGLEGGESVVSNIIITSNSK